SSSEKRQADVIHFQGMRDLGLVRLPLSVQVSTQVEDPELLQGLNATTLDRVQSFAPQERRHLLPDQTLANQPPDAPIENPLIELVLIEPRKSGQLRVGDATRIGYKPENGLVLPVVQGNGPLLVSHNLALPTAT